MTTFSFSRKVVIPAASGGSFPCPDCGAKTGVKDSRPSLRANGIRRRRKCEGCEKRFTTLEIVREDERWQSPQVVATRETVAALLEVVKRLQAQLDSVPYLGDWDDL